MDAAAVVGAEAVVVVVAAADVDETTHASFDATVIDCLGGWARLVERSPTLDGSVPLRVARACVPLLDGNAFGLQVVVDAPIVIRRRYGRWGPEPDPRYVDLERRRRGVVPMLVARTMIDGTSEWPSLLGEGVVSSRRGTLRVWTGLLVRPTPGRWLWVQSCANRRNRSFDVRARVIPDPSRYVPLWLELEPAAGVTSVRLHGEVACLAALRPGVTVRRGPVEAMPELARAHLDFYRQEYFEAKKRGEVTRRYRRTISGEPRDDAPPQAVVSVGEIATAPGRVEPMRAALLPDGPAADVPPELGAIEQMVFGNAVPFRIAWDGVRVDVGYDRGVLARHAESIERRFRSLVGDADIDANPGALWYLTKYFTMHPDGEPHFFVKPWAFTSTPPGWSCVLDGVHAPGYDVMRGVVHTDGFVATPAVFWLDGHREFEVPAEQPLLRVTAVPRELLHPKIATSDLRDTEQP